jgi:hypothetical protein
MNKMKRQVVEINGEQVFTSDFVFEQMQAQSCRIDKATTVSCIALIVAIIAVVACIYILRS